MFGGDFGWDARARVRVATERRGAAAKASTLLNDCDTARKIWLSGCGVMQAGFFVLL